MSEVLVALFEGGPSRAEIGDTSSVWFVREELRADYVGAVTGFDRRRFRELEANVQAGLSGSKTIASSWLLGLRAEARAAAGLEPIPLDRIGEFRVTQMWPDVFAGFDAKVAFAAHQAAITEAVNALETREFQEALAVSCGSAACPACGVKVTGVSSVLCGPCSSVAEVVRLDRARELGRERVEGRTTRLEVVERWLSLG